MTLLGKVEQHEVDAAMLFQSHGVISHVMAVSSYGYGLIFQITDHRFGFVRSRRSRNRARDDCAAPAPQSSVLIRKRFSAWRLTGASQPGPSRALGLAGAGFSLR